MRIRERAPVRTLAAVVTLAVGAASAPALAQFGRPVACSDCISNWYYYDHLYDPEPPEGPDTNTRQDWSCARSTYDDHRGTDFSLAGGNGAISGSHDVIAAADGEVVVAHDGEPDRCTACSGTGCGLSHGWGYGNYVVIDHGDYRAYYAHMRRESLRVGVGDTVTCGQVVGEIASSGCSTGAHLHFEVRPTGRRAIDPFAGECSSATSLWSEQGEHRGLPGLTCGAWTDPGSTPGDEPPPTPSCPAGTYSIWTCTTDRTTRVRCIGGAVERQACAYGCVVMPLGVDDYCAPRPDSTGTTPTCSSYGIGENRDSCAGTAPETWRCVCSARIGTTVSQVCRGGVWLNYTTSPRDCSACSGSYSSACGV